MTDDPTRKLTASLTVSAFMLAGTPAPAAVQPNQDGLVNVAIGDVTILEDTNVGLAAQVAAQVCGIKVGPLAVLGRAVDRSGEARSVCESAQGPVTLEQHT